LHIISIITTSDRVKEDIGLDGLQYLKRFGETELRDCNTAGRLPRVLDVVEEEWDPVCCFVEPRRERVSCGSEVPSADRVGVCVCCIGTSWVERMGGIAGAG
jgi:hypothetical protein